MEISPHQRDQVEHQEGLVITFSLSSRSFLLCLAFINVLNFTELIRKSRHNYLVLEGNSLSFNKIFRAVAVAITKKIILDR